MFIINDNANAERIILFFEYLIAFINDGKNANSPIIPSADAVIEILELNSKYFSK